MLVTIKVEVDQETYERLVEQAFEERRPMWRHAGVILRRAVGLPFPSVIDGDVVREHARPVLATSA